MKCLYCGKAIVGRKRKYCDRFCQRKKWEGEHREEQRKQYVLKNECINEDGITKKCPRCQIILPLVAYAKAIHGKYRRASWCRECTKAHNREHNGIGIKKYIAEELRKDGFMKCSRCNNTKQLCDFRKFRGRYQGWCRECHKEYKRSDQAKENRKEYYEQWVGSDLHKKRLEWRRCYEAKRRKDDVEYQLGCSMRVAVWHSLKGLKDSKGWESIVGYSLQDLKDHLERQFTKTMTWDNYGSYWQVDHIVPKSLFNYSGPHDIGFKECWALKNLRPLTKKANLKKHAKYKGHFQMYLQANTAGG